VKNESLADQVKAVEQQNASAEVTRESVIEAIRARYTLSA
jgi:hypothetical protein